MSDGTFDSIHEAFNARFVRSEEIGSTFVSSPFLRDTLLPRHTAIIGPRGSGKTTLLKMLTLPALMRWRGPERKDLISGLRFVSVYVAASLTWSANFRSFSDHGVGTRAEELLSVALFRHHTMLALVNTWTEMRSRIFGADPSLKRFSLDGSDDTDTAFVRALAEGWKVKAATSTAGGLTRALKDRIRILQRLSVRAGYSAIDTTAIFDEFPEIGDHFLDDTSTFLDMLGEYYKYEFGLALCFDEIEIASSAIARSIISSIRSIDQRIFIKYSAAPYVGIAAEDLLPNAPSQGNDFKLVFLTSFASKDTRPFSEALLRSLLARRGVDAEPAAFLGRSLIDENDRNDLNKYKPEGLYQRRFERLAGIDPSFRDYLSSKAINVTDLSQGKESDRASDIRKILWPVVIRSELLFSHQKSGSLKPQRRLRSKSSVADFYTGATSLMAICEGNPRWLIGLMEPLLQEVLDAPEPRGESKPRRSAQKHALDRMIASYFALLSTVPSSDKGRGIASLVELVERIGVYFRLSVLAARFNADPVLSFTVDSNLPPSIKEMIGRGVNLGAFITTQVTAGSNGYRVGDVVGLKIRLSNLFAPYFNLPLIGGRTINLSTILDRSRVSSGEKLVADLFEGLQ